MYSVGSLKITCACLVPSISALLMIGLILDGVSILDLGIRR